MLLDRFLSILRVVLFLLKFTIFSFFKSFYQFLRDTNRLKPKKNLWETQKSLRPKKRKLKQHKEPQKTFVERKERPVLGLLLRPVEEQPDVLRRGHRDGAALCLGPQKSVLLAGRHLGAAQRAAEGFADLVHGLGRFQEVQHCLIGVLK